MMYHNFNFEATLASSLRAQWALDDVLRADQDLDFSRNFMPESLARTAAIETLNPFEHLSSIESAPTSICAFSEWWRSSSCHFCSIIRWTACAAMIRKSVPSLTSPVRKLSTSTCSSASTKRSFVSSR